MHTTDMSGNITHSLVCVSRSMHFIGVCWGVCICVYYHVCMVMIIHVLILISDDVPVCANVYVTLSLRNKLQTLSYCIQDPATPVQQQIQPITTIERDACSNR